MLLQGDLLAVQLFIGAAALTTFSAAMTHAGWTHKMVRPRDVRLAALLSITCVGWPYSRPEYPRAIMAEFHQ